MMAIGRHFAHVGHVGFLRWRAVRIAAALFVAVMPVVAAGRVSAAKAASLPSLIAYVQGGFGIGLVQAGHPSTARLIYQVPYTSATSVSWPSWSPNGQELAFHVHTPSTGDEIVLTNRSGRVISVPLVNEQGGIGSLSWAPDGRQIAFICRRGTTSTQFLNVCVLDVVTGASRVLAVSTFSEGILQQVAARLSWSPRGNVIAVDGEHDISTGPCTGLACGQPDIALIDVATGTMTPLGDTGFEEPAFSPNGREIVFLNAPGTVHANSEPSGVDIMSASGTDIRNVVSNADSPNWSPDGKDIVFSSFESNLSFSALFTVSVQGGQLTKATDEANANTGSPVWVQPLTVCTVPKLKGQTLAATKQLVALAGCVLGKVTGPKKNRSKLRVVSQKPAANQNVATGTKVNVQIR